MYAEALSNLVMNIAGRHKQLACAAIVPHLVWDLVSCLVLWHLRGQLQHAFSVL